MEDNRDANVEIAALDMELEVLARQIAISRSHQNFSELRDLVYRRSIALRLLKELTEPKPSHEVN